MSAAPDPSSEQAIPTPDLVRPPEWLDAFRQRRDELVATLTAAEQQLEVVRRQLREITDVSEFRRGMAEVREEIVTARGRIADTRRETADVADAVLDLNRFVSAARAQADAARRSAAAAERAGRAAQAEAAGVVADTGQARRTLLGVRELMALYRTEVGTLNAEARLVLDRLKAAVEEAQAAAPPSPTSPREAVPSTGDAELAPAGGRPAPPAAGPAPDGLPVVELVAPGERAPDAADQLIRYLNEVWEVKKEQGGLLQTMADRTDDADLRSELERHRERAEQQKQAIEGRVRELGGEPAGGRGLLGTIGTRLWDAIHHPGDDGEDVVEALLKAVSAAELGAGLYLAVYSLAAALEDEKTAGLAVTLLRQERESADQLRARITLASVGAARRRTPVEGPV